jgi:hypothetical protein
VNESLQKLPAVALAPEGHPKARKVYQQRSPMSKTIAVRSEEGCIREPHKAA